MNPIEKLTLSDGSEVELTDDLLALLNQREVVIAVATWLAATDEARMQVREKFADLNADDVCDQMVAILKWAGIETTVEETHPTLTGFYL